MLLGRGPDVGAAGDGAEDGGAGSACGGPPVAQCQGTLVLGSWAGDQSVLPCSYGCPRRRWIALVTHANAPPAGAQGAGGAARPAAWRRLSSGGTAPARGVPGPGGEPVADIPAQEASIHTPGLASSCPGGCRRRGAGASTGPLAGGSRWVLASKCLGRAGLAALFPTGQEA